ncbi:ADP-ribosylation/crystallin J1 [Rhizobium phaseoli]|uniref:ADP-ribosylation/crystallin J1 n=1 Tax=Rhizobium phaseoli TaxID=396 RepID=UPI000F89969D|nr:ADP-ribosylation/crystallin J1 [Rhizobium phaseoli]RUM21888.1 ADP-ribosylation/crystallin J1 [Rhizobium phaseoli]
MSDDIETVTLWRPVGPEELMLIRERDMRGFPPRLPDQPILYPVLSEDYAVKIARDWNVPRSGSGFVTEFQVRKDYLDRHAVQEAGGRAHLEYWIPAEEMDQFNAAIVGAIVVTQNFSLAIPRSQFERAEA